MDGKVNSEFDLLGNFIENIQEIIINLIINQRTASTLQKIKNYFKRHFAVRVIWDSMSGVLEHGDIVRAKKVTRFTRYNKGDIIVFKRNGIRIIHIIEEIIMVNGEIQYRTKGVNNLNVDRQTISRSDILGKIDVSKVELNKLMDQISQGKINVYEAFGMSEEVEGKLAKLIEELQAEFGIELDLDVTDLSKVAKLIQLGNEQYDFKNNKAYKGLRILQKELSKKYIEEFGKSMYGAADVVSGLIDINLELDSSETLDILVKVILGHELSHNKLRGELNELFAGFGIDTWLFGKYEGQVADSRATRIEEFLVDVDFMFLSGYDTQRVKDHAKQYSKWIDMILSKEWSPYVEQGEKMNANDMEPEHMINIMHYFVVMEHIKDNILQNDGYTKKVFDKISDYKNEIIDNIVSKKPHYKDEILNSIDNYIIGKMRSYIRNPTSIEDFLGNFLDTDTTTYSEDENWIFFFSDRMSGLLKDGKLP